jgi:hypothetical protein
VLLLADAKHRRLIVCWYVVFHLEIDDLLQLLFIRLITSEYSGFLRLYIVP